MAVGNIYFSLFRVLLVGTSRSPFDAELKPFVKSYEKIVLIPRPDYASRFSELNYTVNFLAIQLNKEL